jgi:DNA-directed RNA polymerase specialized sigma24 family protein
MVFLPNVLSCARMSDDESGKLGAAAVLFENTRWSVVRAAAQSGGIADVALTWLCKAYWVPLYAFLRRVGRSKEDAEDVVQAFFARLQSGELLSSATPERGRFRSFILTAVRNLDRDIHRASSSQKRGGNAEYIPLDVALAEERWQVDSGDSASPEVAFDRAWAGALMERAASRLREGCIADGKEAHFLEFFPRISGSSADATFAVSAQRLGITEAAARMVLSRLRRRYAEAIRAEIAETVNSREEEADELRYLLACFA